MLILWVNEYSDTLKELVKVAFSHLEQKPQIRVSTKLDKLPSLDKGDVVVAFGKGTLKALGEDSYVPKNKSHSTLRGRAIKVQGSTFFVSYDPNVVNVEYKFREELIWDLRLAERFHRTGTTEPIIGEYRFVKSFSKVIRYVKDKYDKTGKPVELASDLETLGLYPWYHDKYIVSISFTYEKGQSDLMYFRGWDDQPNEKVLKQLKWLLTTKKVSLRGANWKYDSTWIRVKWGIECTNHKFDTTIAGSILDENRSNSLNLHAKIYTSMGGYDDHVNRTYPKDRMDLIPANDFLVYAGGDTDATFQVAKVTKKQLLRDKKLAKFYINILQPASKAFEHIETRGLLVDRNRYAELKNDVENKIESLTEEAMSMIPRRLRLKYSDDLKLSRPALLQDFLFTKAGLNLKPKVLTDKTNKPSTAADHLLMFKDDPVAGKFATVMQELNIAKKTLQTYIDGFLVHLRPDDRFHPSYFLYKGGFENKDKDGGTNTGRLSATDPAVQTIPKHTVWSKAIRRCFIAPPGYVFFERDYSQGELRIAACIAEEPNLIRAYQKGIDVHCNTGARLSGYSLEDFMLLGSSDPVYIVGRQQAKPVNFGYLYGMQAPGLVEYARKSYNLIMSLKEAQAHRDAYFEEYPELLIWHEREKNLARRDGYRRSPLGRIRHLPLINSPIWKVSSQAERQAINSGTQSTLSDMCIWSISEAEKQLTPHLLIAGMTHDSIYGYVEEDKLEYVHYLGEIMENLPLQKLGWRPPLKFITDGQIGPSMGELEDYAYQKTV